MRRRHHRRGPARLLLWGTILVVVLLGYLNAHPIRLGSDNVEVRGRFEPREHSSDVLVVVWPGEITRSAEADRFQEVDWSWAWVEALESELGPVRVCHAEAFSAEVLDGTRFLVISHSAAHHPTLNDAVHLLEQYVNQGGVLVLERPQGALRTVFSADGRGGMRTPRAITYVADLDETLADALMAMPLFTRFVGSTGPLAGAETLLAMDGAPVVYRINRAEGVVITVDFNVGLALVSLQQGRPDGSGFELEAGDDADVEDLVADEAMRDAEVPYADLLEHFLVQIAMARDRPLVGYWPYPGGRDGALLLSHNVAHGGDSAVWLAEYEQEAGASSTFFFGFRGTPTAEGVARFANDEAGLGVWWERGQDDESVDNRKGLGVGGLQPLYREANLAEQRQVLLDSIAHGRLEPNGVRLRGGRWSAEYAETFRAMAAQGIAFDSSYGPRTWDPSERMTFWHGTARPFQVLDSNGLPLGILEIPLMVPYLRQIEHLEQLERLLRASQRGFHQAITVQVDADMLFRDNGLLGFDLWQRLLERAESRGHPVISLDQLVAERLARRRSALRSQVRPREDSRGRTVDGFILDIEVVPASPDLWLRLPRAVGEATFRSARSIRSAPAEATSPERAVPGGRNERSQSRDSRSDRNDGDVDTEPLEGRDVSLFGTDLILLPIPPDTERIEAEYR